jgi:hypothetical protein
MANQEPFVTAVVYKVTLQFVLEEEPLKGCSYFGQAVRHGNEEKVAASRWCEEVYESMTTKKQVGFIALLSQHGKDSFTWSIVDSRRGQRNEVQLWANKREIELIAENGGPLQSMHKRLKQTLNQNGGGKGNTARSIDAYCAVAFHTFKKEMNQYVVSFGTSKVSKDYVSPNGYRLYSAMKNVRSGMLLEGRLNEEENRAWLTSLPDWSFSVHDSQFERFKAELLAYADSNGTADVPNSHVSDSGYNLGMTVANVRQGAFLKGGEADKRRVWLESLPGWIWNASNSARAKDAWSVASKKRMKNPEFRNKVVSSLQKGRDDAIAKRREEYVENARKSVLPYEPTKKKRKVGEFYYRPDGSIGRCTTQMCLKRVCEG